MSQAPTSAADVRPYIIKTYDRWIILIIVLVGGWLLFRPLFGYAVYFRGVSFERDFDYRVAQHYYEKATRVYPYTVDAWYSWADLWRIQSPHDPQAPRDSIAIIKRGLARNPHSERLWWLLGRTYFFDLKNDNAALAALTRAMWENSRDWVVWDYAAWAAHRLGDDRLATRYWRRVLELAPNQPAVAQALRRYGKD